MKRRLIALAVAVASYSAAFAELDHAWAEEPAGAKEPWPIASMPFVTGRELWMVADGQQRFTSKSVDGVRWVNVPSDANWGERYGARAVFFRDRAWLLGGTVNRKPASDIWSSSDGVTWTQALRRTPWSGRSSHAVAVFKEKLWLLGGNDGKHRNDVWVSQDGVDWKRVTKAAPWQARGGHVVAVHRGELWLISGGHGWTQQFPDVWSSPDGTNWTERTGAAPWGKRVAFGAAAFDGKLWVFGGVRPGGPGQHFNDVWCSNDGVNWQRVIEHAPWKARAAEHCVVFANQLWLFGGKYNETPTKGGYMHDVWHMAPTDAARKRADAPLR